MQKHPIERVTSWVGSPQSLLFHTTLFAGFFIVALSGEVAWDTMLLVLTTLVSLEAIYFSIFIQMTVNRHTESLREVEADVEEIQVDIDEIQEDVEEMSEDLEVMTEDDIQSAAEPKRLVTLDVLMSDVRKILEDLEQFKQRK